MFPRTVRVFLSYPQPPNYRIGLKPKKRSAKISQQIFHNISPIRPHWSYSLLARSVALAMGNVGTRSPCKVKSGCVADVFAEQPMVHVTR